MSNQTKHTPTGTTDGQWRSLRDSMTLGDAVVVGVLLALGLLLAYVCKGL